MKPHVKNLLPGSAPPASRPAPFVHARSEPEFDPEQLARRASQVTAVLEHILDEHPPVLDPGSRPPPARTTAPPSV